MSVVIAFVAVYVAVRVWRRKQWKQCRQRQPEVLCEWDEAQVFIEAVLVFVAVAVLVALL